MAKENPFEFDISVSSSKKNARRTKRGMSGAFETSSRICEHPNCDKSGQYRAPVSPDNLNKYLWFCKIHAGEYNQKWSFFENSPPSSATESKTSHKESENTRYTKDEQRAWARLGVDDPHEVLGMNGTRNFGKSISGTRQLPMSDRKALDILGAKEHWTREEIRKCYKKLIKVLHPDLNGGDRSEEDQLQEVVWAWNKIKDNLLFRS